MNFINPFGIFKKDQDTNIKKGAKIQSAEDKPSIEDLNLDIYIYKDKENFKQFRNIEYKKDNEYIHMELKWHYYIFDKEENVQMLEKIKENIYNNRENNAILYSITNKDEGIKYLDEVKKFFEIKDIIPHIVFIISEEKNYQDYDSISNALINYDENLFVYCWKENHIEFTQLYKIFFRICSFLHELGDFFTLPIKDPNISKVANKETNIVFLYQDDAFKERNNYLNILVVGQFNSGKSTIINRLLGEKKCKIGKGLKKTRKLVQYFHKKYPICFIDMPGFESDKDIENIKELVKKCNEYVQEFKTRIHIILITINCNGRIKEKEMELVKFIYELDKSCNIYFVLTKSKSRDFGNDSKDLINLHLKRAKIFNNYQDNVFPVNLVCDPDCSEENFGMKELFKKISEDFQKNRIKVEKLKKIAEYYKNDKEKMEKEGFTVIKNSQFFDKIKKLDDWFDVSLKRAELFILSNIALSVGIGWAPPIADFAGLTGIQIIMIKCIASCFGFKNIDIQKFKKIMGKDTTSIIGTSVSTFINSSISVLKFFPFFGYLIASSILSTTGGISTRNIGNNAIKYFKELRTKEGLLPLYITLAETYNKAIDGLEDIKKKMEEEEEKNRLKVDKSEEEKNGLKVDKSEEENKEIKDDPKETQINKDNIQIENEHSISKLEAKNDYEFEQMKK